MNSATTAGAYGGINIVCRCNRTVPLEGERFRCSCGAELGYISYGVAVVGRPGPYGGGQPADLDSYAEPADPDQVAFEDVLPIARGSRVLEIGAGLGAVSFQLAKWYTVTALETVLERARSIETRRRREGIENLTVICGDIRSTRLAGRFDLVLAGGPESAEMRPESLRRMADLLAPDGYIYFGAPNRFGWTASAVRSGRSYHAYRKLFRKAGLRIACMWIAPSGCQRLADMVPLERSAIQAYTSLRWIRPEVTRFAFVKNRLKRFCARRWIWRRFGAAYIFLLESGRE